MNSSSTAPLGGTAPAPGKPPADPPDETVHVGSGPRIDPAAASQASRVQPLLPQRLKPKPVLRRKDDDEPDMEVGGSDASSASP